MSNGSKMLRGLLALHDRITLAGYWLAALGLMAICSLYCMEVVLRYFLNSPTTWSSDVITFLLLTLTFSAFPYATKTASHVAVTFVMDANPAAERYLGALINLIGIVLCGFIGYIASITTWQLYTDRVETIGNYTVGKWSLMIFIAFGFINSALWHVRFLLSGQSPVQSEIKANMVESQ